VAFSARRHSAEKTHNGYDDSLQRACQYKSTTPEQYILNYRFTLWTDGAFFSKKYPALDQLIIDIRDSAGAQSEKKRTHGGFALKNRDNHVYRNRKRRIHTPAV
jgi:hypothetical protein